MVNRLDKLRQAMRNSGLDGFIVTNMQNWRYISGFTGDNAVLLITEKDKILITDFRYLDQADEETDGYEIVKSTASTHDNLAEHVAKLGLKKVGFEESTISYREYKSLNSKLSGTELFPTSNVIEKIRQVKDNEEIKAIRRAAEIADKAFKHILNIIKPGISEIEIAAELEYQMKKMGSEEPAFDTIIASGVRSALPHGAASSKTLGDGEFVTIDFGAVIEGYHSDMTRTMIIGEPDSKQKKIYDIVLQAQVTAVQAVRPWAKCLEIDSVARNIIDAEGYGENFGHGLGHSVGLEIHERPAFNTRDDTVLEPGMVMTVEPGIYISNWGGVRIEDLVLVTENGYEVISTSPKHLIML